MFFILNFEKNNMVYSQLLEAKQKNKKQFAVLIDPDKTNLAKLETLLFLSKDNIIDYWFVGGSLLTNDTLDESIKYLKKHSNIPVVLFPGNYMQINRNADGILFLSLISGRNPEMLIGKHVIAAPYLKKTSLEIIPTGYMLIDSGRATSAQYISHTLPIPSDKNDIAVCTAMAGEMLGMACMYLEAGSGAVYPVPLDMIEKVSKNISVPLIVGGGIDTAEKAKKACIAGADIIVVGNAIEKDNNLIKEISSAIHS